MARVLAPPGSRPGPRYTGSRDIGRRYLSFPRDAGAIAALDGLRAAAILLVLARHAIRPFRDAETPFLPVFGWDAATPLINGWIGVDLFFVLSGFLISHGIIRRKDNFRLGQYIVRRALRIVPAYYAVMAIVAAGLIPFYTIAPEMLGFRVLYHVLFLQDYLPANIVIAFWSLGAEEKFYIAAPFVLIPLLRLKSRRMQYTLLGALVVTPLAFRLNLLAGGAVVADYESFFRTLRSPFHRGFDGLAIGMLVALLWRDRDRLAWLNDRTGANTLFWTGAAVIGWMWLRIPMLDTIEVFERTFLQLVLAAGFGAMLLGALAGGGPQRVMGSKTLVPVARLSYSLYLVHMAIIPAAVYVTFGSVLPFGTGYSAQFWVFLPIYAVFAVIGALILHFFVEKPVLEYRDRRNGSTRC